MGFMYIGTCTHHGACYFKVSSGTRTAHFKCIYSKYHLNTNQVSFNITFYPHTHTTPTMASTPVTSQAPPPSPKTPPRDFPPTPTCPDLNINDDGDDELEDTSIVDVLTGEMFKPLITKLLGTMNDQNEEMKAILKTIADKQRLYFAKKRSQITTTKQRLETVKSVISKKRVALDITEKKILALKKQLLQEEKLFARKEKELQDHDVEKVSLETTFDEIKGEYENDRSTFQVTDDETNARNVLNSIHAGYQFLAISPNFPKDGACTVCKVTGLRLIAFKCCYEYGVCNTCFVKTEQSVECVECKSMSIDTCSHI